MEKPEFLTVREWEYIQSLEKHNGDIPYAAMDLGVSQSAVESCLSRVRKKMDSAYKFKRRYGKLIERRR